MPPATGKPAVVPLIAQPDGPGASRHTRQAVGSFAAAFVGWLVVFVFGLIASVGGGFGAESFVFLLVVALVYAVVILGVWLVALWPLYGFVPRRSVLWFWPVCTGSGLLAGTLIASLVFLVGKISSWRELLSLRSILGCAVYGGSVGAITCLFGSLTVSYFLGPVVDGSPAWAWRHPGVPRFPRLGRAFLHLKEKFRHLAGQ